jgi:hypothetical protein
METIKSIKDRISFLKENIGAIQSKISFDTDRFSEVIFLENIQNELRELESKLYYENTLRNKEIISLRLIGGMAQYGTFPLEVIGDITTSFSKALYKTSQYIAYGNKGGSKIESFLKNSLDLRLEGVSSGSTIFNISARTNPDLFGNSTIQSSLESTFDFLNSDDDQRFVENIEKIGTKSPKYFSSFLFALIENNLEVEISWEGLDLIEKKWIGNRNKLTAIYNTLKDLKILPSNTIHITGKIVVLSIKNKIEVFDESANKTYTIRYDSTFSDKIKFLHIGEIKTFSIDETKIESIISQKEKTNYSLIDIV